MGGTRCIVLTDIVRGIEVDDIQSLVRLLLYSNDIEIEGLIAATSCFVKRETQKNALLIHRVIDGYEKVRDNLARHADGYPEAGELHAVTAADIPALAKGRAGALPMYRSPEMRAWRL